LAETENIEFHALRSVTEGAFNGHEGVRDGRVTYLRDFGDHAAARAAAGLD